MAAAARAERYRTLCHENHVLLDVLAEHATVTLADLADEVAVRQWGLPLPSVPAECVEAVYHDLYAVTVPALEAADLVAYDEDADLVSRLGYGADAPPVLTTEAPSSHRDY